MFTKSLLGLLIGMGSVSHAWTATYPKSYDEFNQRFFTLDGNGAVLKKIWAPALTITSLIEGSRQVRMYFEKRKSADLTVEKFATNEYVTKLSKGAMWVSTVTGFVGIAIDEFTDPAGAHGSARVSTEGIRDFMSMSKDEQARVMESDKDFAGIMTAISAKVAEFDAQPAAL